MQTNCPTCGHKSEPDGLLQCECGVHKCVVCGISLDVFNRVCSEAGEDGEEIDILICCDCWEKQIKECDREGL